MSFDRRGRGDLIPESTGKLARIISKTRWSHETLKAIKSGTFGPTEAILVLLISPEGQKYDIPLCSKAYAIKRGARDWYSVSARILDSATSELVGCYIHEQRSIRMSDRRGARTDAGDLRFGSTYAGWYVDETALLENWLRNPASLTVQATLNGGSNP